MIRTERTITDYDKLMGPVRKARQEKTGKQPGEPENVAQILLKIVEAEQPPSHLLLGHDALKLVLEKLENLSTEFTLWEKVTCPTDFD